jgi:allophanate hydrolase subunit 1
MPCLSSDLLSLARYMETIRNRASYLPDTLEFMARANGLPSRRAAADALIGEHLVVSVGFFCGTPIALPLDPRKREIRFIFVYRRNGNLNN